FNAHKNFLGFGDYDVNVLTAALNENECDLEWHDNRTNIEAADLSTSVGLIVHIQPEWFFRRGHWFAIRYFDQVVTAPVVPKIFVGQPRAARSEYEREERDYEAKTYEPGFWNLDSKLPHPEFIGDRDCLNIYLHDLAKKNRMHVLRVVPLKSMSVSSSST
ncbi:Josephin-1, partial [Coemansia sp. IMI 209127]